jgi:hypothetical protein
MSKIKNKPGIHLLPTKWKNILTGKPEYFWHIVARNGRIIARSSETYTRKSGAVKSIKIAAAIFCSKFIPESNGPIAAYFDHTKPGSPLQSYL